MRVLVTGGLGFIGSNFIRHMLSRHRDLHITNLDKITYCGNPENLKDVRDDKRYAFVKGDICDRETVDALMGEADAVINFAAESHVDRSIKYPGDFIMTNFFGVKVLLESAKARKVKKFVQIGTDEVYGSVQSGFSREGDTLKPSSPYSASKAAADLLALSYHTTYGLPVVVVRSSNNFGPYQYPEKMVPLFITNLIEGRKVPVYGDGGNVRDWLFVEDNCSAIELVFQKGEPGSVYNAGGGNQLDNISLTKKILALTGKGEKDMKFVKDRPGHDRRYALDPSRLTALGWKTSGDFDGDLAKTVKWYEANAGWWKPLKERAEIIEW